MADQTALFQSTDHDPGCKRLLPIPPSWTVAAQFSGADNCYRDSLEHIWSDAPLWMFLMMNPSGADHRFLDSTVAKTAKMAQFGGAGGQVIVNACAYRATDRMRLLEIADPVGPKNHSAILCLARDVSKVIVAHGQLPGKLQVYASDIVRKLREAGHTLHVLRIQNGQPIHPLARGKAFVPATTAPVVWPEAGAI